MFLELFISLDLFISSLVYFQFASPPPHSSSPLHFVLYSLLFCCQIDQLFSFLMIILKISPYHGVKQQPSLAKQSATHQLQITGGSSMESTFQGEVAVDVHQQPTPKLKLRREMLGGIHVLEQIQWERDLLQEHSC